MGGQQNYFLLAVVRGNLSIQTSRGDRQILVTSGPKISDGEWKKLNTPLDGCMRNWDWVRQNSSILEWTLQDSKELMLRLRGTLFWSHSYTQALCSGESQFLQLQLVIGMGVTKATMKLTDWDYELLKRVLSQPGSMVYLGGGPEGVSSFHGCLQAKIQGVNVDLDLAEVKHGDVRSHSCPAALDVRDGK
ncbi:unnamed protein product [Coregonus sp. 'balchen']|nr:unnamed protein product [Coregonus sp. 'balchen']